MAYTLATAIKDDLRERADQRARSRVRPLTQLVQPAQYVGEVFSLGYDTALVQIHDFHRRRVGGIPSLSFLIATRVNPDDLVDYTEEDASVVLLRVMDAAPLPNEAEALRVRVETAQRVSGEPTLHWGDRGSMDPATHNLLSFAGVKCRVIGTFFLENAPSPDAEDGLVLRFGSDLSNYYPNRGLKVYKPNEQALYSIVNFRDPYRYATESDHAVRVGDIRYASTNRGFQGVANVAVELVPADLLAQKTALFGMTRTGKSNTTKTIIKAVFNLRHNLASSLSVGQVVFDPDGEYANENMQDANADRDPAAIKNIGATNADGTKTDVVTYGVLPHPNDPHRKLMLLNFFDESSLQIGKTAIDASLASDGTKFIQNFRQVMFERPEATDRSATTRYDRRVLVYRALLAKAGFEVPDNFQADTRRLFKRELLDAMAQSTGASRTAYQSAARVLAETSPPWRQLAEAFVHLDNFIEDKTSGYQAFDQQYIDRPGGSGDPWADEDLKKLLTMYRFPNGVRQIGQVRNQHTKTRDSDYADDIYLDLVQGRLVIVDQSSGEPQINQLSAERIMWSIFRHNQGEFRNGETPPNILVYVEEAHNLLPEGSDKDLQDVWVRTAKEGAKYNIGMVYATQEVSSIQKNILKNTANWFIGHLNNTDETRELSKYYDFADFEPSIRRAQDRGFVRVKTLSNMFVVPAQIVKFEV
jgi:hypothetical protein